MDTSRLLKFVTSVRKELYGDRINISDKEIQAVLVEAKKLYNGSALVTRRAPYLPARR